MSIASNLGHKQRRVSRRRFLQTALPALSAMIAWEAAKGIDTAETDSSGIQKRPEYTGYRETAHVRRYYDTARF